jgi:hypothetical protein
VTYPERRIIHNAARALLTVLVLGSGKGDNAQEEAGHSARTAEEKSIVLNRPSCAAGFIIDTPPQSQRNYATQAKMPLD